MKRQTNLATWTGLLLGSVCALLLVSAHASSRVTEEFHHTYPLTANGRVSLKNVNGAVHISAWDQNEVKVDAVKYAGTKERLDDAQIRVSASSDYVSIKTEYRDHNLTFNDDDHDNPAGVEYTIMVPRGARLDEISLVNGGLDIQGVTGEVRANCVNGHLNARGLGGRVELSTVNGRLESSFDRLTGSSVDLSAVNGGLDLTLPSDASARLEASTVHGGINNDFGLRVVRHRYVGESMEGELASGGTRIHLSNVNGHIEVRHAGDNRSMSTVRDLSSDRDKDRDNDRDDDDDDNN